MKRVRFSVLVTMVAVSGAPFEFARAQAAAMMAQQSKQKDDSAKDAAKVMAAVMAAMCNQPQGNVAPCIMSALAMMQSSKSDNAGQGAGQSAQALSTGGGGGSQNPKGDQPDDPKRGSGGDAATTGQIKGQLQSRGAVISPDGTQMTLPDGNTVPLDSNSGTEAGMKSAGLTDAQIAMGKQSLAEALAKMGSVKGKEMAGDGFGGGGGGGFFSDSSHPDPKLVKKGRKSGKVTGLSKNFHGDKIGVAADDIFEMISNRYKAKEASDTFLK